jgi:SAM-dependent methyltransferase
LKAPTKLLQWLRHPPRLYRISPNDQMYAGSQSQYFAIGQSALQAIDTALRAAGKARSSVRRILDLPCGHGRVCRYLREAFPRAQITACDLERDGVDYCAGTFDAIPVYSDPNPADIAISGDFDLIWCGSLLTHLEERLSREFLAFFCSRLAEGGVLVFTVHGRFSVHGLRNAVFDYSLDANGIGSLLAGYEECGYGYTNYPASGNYGISLTSAHWIADRLEELQELRLLTYTESAWDHHQDVIACARESLEKRLAIARQHWKSY